MATKYYVDLADLALFKQLNDSATAQAIATAEARSLHTVAIDGNTLNFYREEEPVGSATPAYSITLPETDLSNYLTKIADANGGKLLASKADGTFEETSISVADIKAIATSGSSADVTYDNTTSGLTATNVKAALDELASASSGGVASKTVYITETSGEGGDPYSKRYGIYQGSTGSTASPVAGEKLVDIDIPKDMVVEAGSVGTVVTADEPYAGAVVGDKYIDLTIANATSDHIYIPANSLVDVYTAQQNATQIQLAISNGNVISAEIVDGSVDTDALGALAVTTAKIADDAVTEAKIADEAVTEDKLSQAVQTKLNAASGVQSVTEGSTNGTIDVDGTDVAVHGLGSAAYADTTDFDAAGSATAAKNDVIGASTDAASANTIYGAKAYADAATAAIPESDIRALFNSASV